MKLRNLLFIALSLFITGAYAQTAVTKVTVKDEVYYLTKNIGYNITGIYKYESKGEPIVQLNKDGTGLFQLHDMSQTKMVWGIECDAKGAPKELKTDWGFAYRLWYQIKEKHKGKSWESGVIDEWDIVQFSIHTDENNIYILGERIKSY